MVKGNEDQGKKAEGKGSENTGNRKRPVFIRFERVEVEKG